MPASLGAGAIAFIMVNYLQTIAAVRRVLRHDVNITGSHAFVPAFKLALAKYLSAAHDPNRFHRVADGDLDLLRDGPARI